MRGRRLFDGKYLTIDIHDDVEVQLEGEGWVEIEGENSILRLYFDGGDISSIERRLQDARISLVDTTNSFIREKDAEILIQLYREDI